MVTSGKGDCHMAQAGSLTLGVQEMPACLPAHSPGVLGRTEFGEVMSQIDPHQSLGEDRGWKARVSYACRKPGQKELESKLATILLL